MSSASGLTLWCSVPSTNHSIKAATVMTKLWQWCKFGTFRFCSSDLFEHVSIIFRTTMWYQLLDCYLYLWHTIPALSVLEAGQVFLFDPLLYKDRPKVLSRIRFSELLSWLAWWRCAYSIGALQQEGLGFKYTIWVRLYCVDSLLLWLFPTVQIHAV